MTCDLLLAGATRRHPFRERRRAQREQLPSLFRGQEVRVEALPSPVRSGAPRQPAAESRERRALVRGLRPTLGREGEEAPGLCVCAGEAVSRRWSRIPSSAHLHHPRHTGSGRGREG